MKTFQQFQEGLTPIKDILKKMQKDIKSQPGYRPYIQEPGEKPIIVNKS